MKCPNCNNLLPDDLDNCPFCGIYISSAAARGRLGTPRFALKLNADQQIVLNFSDTGTLSVGRKDMKSAPDIDLGPFDEKLAVSRRHGVFIVKEGNLYYIDLSKNGTVLNDCKISTKKAVLLHLHDQISFAGVVGEIVEV